MEGLVNIYGAPLFRIRNQFLNINDITERHNLVRQTYMQKVLLHHKEDIL